MESFLKKKFSYGRKAIYEYLHSDENMRFKYQEEIKKLREEENEFFGIIDLPYDSSLNITEILQRRDEFAKAQGYDNYAQFKCDHHKCTKHNNRKHNNRKCNNRKCDGYLIQMKRLKSIRDNLIGEEANIPDLDLTEEEAFNILSECVDKHLNIQMKKQENIFPWGVEEVRHYNIGSGNSILYALEDHDWKLVSPCTFMINKNESCVSMRIKKWDYNALKNLFHETGHAIKNSYKPDYHPSDMDEEIPGYLMERILAKKYDVNPSKKSRIKNLGLAYADLAVHSGSNFYESWCDFVGNELSKGVPENLLEIVPHLKVDGANLWRREFDRYAIIYDIKGYYDIS